MAFINQSYQQLLATLQVGGSVTTAFRLTLRPVPEPASLLLWAAAWRVWGQCCVGVRAGRWARNSRAEVLSVGCDEGGNAVVGVLFAVGSDRSPAGLYAAAPKRPTGPELVLELWSDASVAVAWQCLLGIATGIAAATGKDGRGNVLAPVELVRRWDPRR